MSWLELRRSGWLSNHHELIDDGVVLARLRYQMMRSDGTIELPDARCWEVNRAPGFGPWNLVDTAGLVQASMRKHDALRERFTVSFGDVDQWDLERRSNLGRRRWVVSDVGTGEQLGTVEQRGLTARVHRLSLPIAPDEPVALVAWMVGLMAIRDQGAAAGGT